MRPRGDKTPEGTGWEHGARKSRKKEIRGARVHSVLNYRQEEESDSDEARDESGDVSDFDPNFSPDKKDLQAGSSSDSDEMPISPITQRKKSSVRALFSEDEDAEGKYFRDYILKYDFINQILIYISNNLL